MYIDTLKKRYHNDLVEVLLHLYYEQRDCKLPILRRQIIQDYNQVVQALNRRLPRGLYKTLDV